MSTPRRKTLSLLVAVLTALSLAFTLLPNTAARADHRPFPKYEMTFQHIHGRKDSNSPAGDGCARDPNPTLSHLTHFGFNAMLNQCDGVRTTVRFYLAEDSPGSPTLQFRFGTTWQYRTAKMLGTDELIWKPVENFTYDGIPAGQEGVPYDPADPVVKDDQGNPVRMSDGTGFFEPIHYVFKDTFGAGEEHTIQFDSYLPADGFWGGMTWGTGSTGDTQGGSIGATANGLWVRTPGKMDFRYVLHSEYLAARGFDQDAELEKDYGLPGLPERDWATEDTGIKDTTFDIVECLENQQLTSMRDSMPINDIYPELPYDTEVLFEDKAGNPGFAQWPWQFSIYQDGEWDPKKGLRPMNRNHSTGAFDPYFNADDSYMSLPYKPTVESLVLDIPGYKYVDNDITILKQGKFDLEQPDNSYNYLVAPNVVLRQVGEYDTQHFYYTYEPIPGSFELVKSAVSYGWDKNSKGYIANEKPLAGAEFELYEVVDTSPSPCGLAPDLENTETVRVCQYRQPENVAELNQMLASEPTECEEKTVRKITLKGTDGSFTTDANGKFTPSGAPSLLPGNYLLREVSAPGKYQILNEWIPFEIGLVTDKPEEYEPVKVSVQNYLPPSKPKLPTTGTSTTPIGGIAMVLTALALAGRRIAKNY